MANFINIKLGGDLERDLSAFEKTVKESVLMSGVAAMARVVYDEVELNASPPRMGRKTGNLGDSIYRVFSPEKSTGEVKTYNVSWNKKKAPHGHLLEFGTSKMAARPFVRPAFARVEDAIKAGKERMRERLGEGVV